MLWAAAAWPARRPGGAPGAAGVRACSHCGCRPSRAGAAAPCVLRPPFSGTRRAPSCARCQPAELSGSSSNPNSRAEGKVAPSPRPLPRRRGAVQPCRCCARPHLPGPAPGPAPPHPPPAPLTPAPARLPPLQGAELARMGIRFPPTPPEQLARMVMVGGVPPAAKSEEVRRRLRGRMVVSGRPQVAAGRRQHLEAACRLLTRVLLIPSTPPLLPLVPPGAAQGRVCGARPPALLLPGRRLRLCLCGV